MLSRQVSWLAGRCCCPVFPKPLRASVTSLDSGSSLTVAGAAPALHRLPSWPRKNAFRRTSTTPVRPNGNGGQYERGWEATHRSRWIPLGKTVKNSALRHSIGNYGSGDGMIECLVVMQPDLVV